MISANRLETGRFFFFKPTSPYVDDVAPVRQSSVDQHRFILRVQTLLTLEHREATVESNAYLSLLNAFLICVFLLVETKHSTSASVFVF